MEMTNEKVAKLKATTEAIDHNFTLIAKAFQSQTETNDEFLELFRNMKEILHNFQDRLITIEQELENAELVYVTSKATGIH